MFRHILNGWVRQLREAETNAETVLSGGAGQTAETQQETTNTETPDPATGDQTTQETPTGGEETHDPDGFPPDFPDWAKKRMSALARQRRESQEEARRLQEELAALRNPQNPVTLTPEQAATLSPEQLNEYIASLARNMANANAGRQTDEQRVAQRWGEIEAEGAKTHGEGFMQAAHRLADNGVGNPDFVKVMAQVPEAADVLVYLSQQDNIDDALRISGLPPVQMAIELAKIAPNARKAVTKQRTKAPAPPSPVGSVAGSTTVSATEPDPKDYDKWIAWRNNQLAQRRR